MERVQRQHFAVEPAQEFRDDRADLARADQTRGNGTQVRAIAHYIEDKVNDVCGEHPYHHEGLQNLQWVLIDYVNVVVHVMHTESRKFYNLEEMWSDAPSQEY